MPAWRGFFGERARTAVYGWSDAAFQLPYMRRKILGYTVHIPLDPELVQQVLLDNAAAYAKPDIVKGLLAPVIGRGLLTSDGKLWREQRRIVAASFTPPGGRCACAGLCWGCRDDDASVERWQDS